MSDITQPDAPTQVIDLNQSAEELAEVIRDAPVIFKETKSGYKTTEFWAALVAVLVPLLAGVPEKLLVPLLAVITAAYTVSRGLAKVGVPAESVPVVPPVEVPAT